MELIPAVKWILFGAAGVALVSGSIGRDTFSADAIHYGLTAFTALSLGAVAGAVIAPLLLPWLPGRAFSLKGALTGAAAALLLPLITLTSGLELMAWSLIIVATSSFLTMNFTGSSTYTSLSGVKKEMKEAVPFQVAAASLGLILWVTALFSGRGTVM
jgi:acetyl-CoA decarbonylase/synthase complex subunit gamma